MQAGKARAEIELADQEGRLRKVQAAHALQMDEMRSELQVGVKLTLCCILLAVLALL